MRVNRLAPAHLLRKVGEFDAKASDILGQKYGRLLVIGATEEKDANGRTLYECQCDCGGTKKVPAYLLMSGRVSSCGCARKGHIRTKEVETGQADLYTSCRCLSARRVLGRSDEIRRHYIPYSVYTR